MLTDRRAVLRATGMGLSSLLLPAASAAASGGTLLGTDPADAAPSASALKDAGQDQDGWYWIQTSSMPTSRLVYCNQTDEGGGWMLICYAPDFVNTGARYPNHWLNGQGSLDRLAVDTMALWFNDGAPPCNSVLKMASPDTGRPPQLANMQIANRVTYSNPQDLALVEYVSDSYATNSTLALNGTWSPVKGHTFMTAPLTINAPRDWIYASNDWWTVCGPSTDLQINGRSGNAQGTGSWTNPNFSSLYGMADVAASTLSVRNDLRTYAVFIR
jgi:hypothetical protein